MKLVDATPGALKLPVSRTPCRFGVNDCFGKAGLVSRVAVYATLERVD